MIEFETFLKRCFFDLTEKNISAIASSILILVTTHICINILANEILAVKPGLCVGKKKFVWQEFVDCYLLNTKVKLKKCLAYGCAVLKKQKIFSVNNIFCYE